MPNTKKKKKKQTFSEKKTPNEIIVLGKKNPNKPRILFPQELKKKTQNGRKNPQSDKPGFWASFMRRLEFKPLKIQEPWCCRLQ